jgi:hypothetical protein
MRVLFVLFILHQLAIRHAFRLFSTNQNIQALYRFENFRKMDNFCLFNMHHSIEGYEAPEYIIQEADKTSSMITDCDYVVIGSGIGGLSCAALLRWYGYNVTVLEAHYLPGGVAHSFERKGFKFDAGPSLWNGMSTKPYNPLRQVIITLLWTLNKRIQTLFSYSFILFFAFIDIRNCW